MQEVIRFWLDRGVDGYRVDAIDRLMKDPELRDDPPASEPFGLPVPEDNAALSLVHSRNAPDIGTALAAIREAAGDALLVGEVYLPAPQLGAVPRAPGLRLLLRAAARALGRRRAGSGDRGHARRARPRG